MHNLNQLQMTAILDRARETDFSLYVMILIGWRHGLRASEICTLTTDNFDLTGDGYLTVQRLKGSLKTTQRLFPEERAALVGLLTGKQQGQYVFTGRFTGTHLTRVAFYKKFHTLCRSLGIPVHLCHPHTLKHTTGLTVIKTGIENARQYLGHKSIASTGQYVRVTDETACAAAAAAFGA